MTVLTLLKIPLNFEGVINEIGKHPFAKILFDAEYICSWVINSCIRQYIYLALFLNKVMNLWNSDVNLVSYDKTDLSISELCCPASNLSSENIVLCIWCTVLMSFSNVSAL